MLIGFDRLDDRLQFRDLERTENVQGWKIKRYSPVRRRTALKSDLPNACRLVHFGTFQMGMRAIEEAASNDDSAPAAVRILRGFAAFGLSKLLGRAYFDASP